MTEWTIVVTVSPMLMNRVQDLQLVSGIETDEPCHLYFVTLRPRMSIDPSSVVITDKEVSCTLRLQHGGSWKEFPLKNPHQLGKGPFRWVSEWPHEEFAIENSEGLIISKGIVGLLQAWLKDWPIEAKEHQIVYIGQAFGQAGERTAWDRLKSHETVQRILAETSPDKQVWLTLAAITDENLSSEIEPRVQAEKSSKEDDEHIALVTEAIRKGSFREREAVALAEAGLIRYFQPKYNDRMKYTFPARKQVPLESVRSLDFHGLVVELKTMSIESLFGSDIRKASSLHFAGFTIHEDKDRPATLGLEAAESFANSMLRGQI